jgi:hypothetical protein
MDMKLMLVELSYNEDLFNNTASGYLMITDSMGYIETLNMMGNEYIRMTFGKTSDTENQVDKLFRVYKVDKRKPESNMNTESYCIYFCSEEMLLSEQYKVSKSYHNKAISDNILDILKNYLKVPDAKLNYIAKTYGTYDFIVPNLRPFDAINWFCTYARPSSDRTGCDMVFYEDKFGFNLISLRALMRQDPYMEYSYDPKNIDQDMQKKVYTVSTYEIMDSFDSLHAINSGIFANRLTSVDPLLRRFKHTDFNYATYVKEETTLNKYPITNNYTNRNNHQLVSTPEAVYKFSFTNWNQQDSPIIKKNPGLVERDFFTETYIPYRTAQLQLANYTRVKISVPGDPGITAGMVIVFQLLSKNPANKAPDAFYSGKYLVTAVRHMITMTEYKTVLEITKESTTEPYAAINTSLPIWQNSVNGKMS